MDRDRLGSDVAAGLALRLEIAAMDLIHIVERIDPDRWDRVEAPGVWSVGKDAEHVSEAAIYHQWIVMSTIGERVASRRPSIERSRLTAILTSQEAIELIRSRTDTGLRLVAGLTQEQLGLPTRPPRAGDPSLATTIERVLIGHYDVHRLAIQAKLE